MRFDTVCLMLLVCVHKFNTASVLWKFFTDVCGVGAELGNSTIMSCLHTCTAAINCSQQVRRKTFKRNESNISQALTCQSTSTKSI